MVRRSSRCSAGRLPVGPLRGCWVLLGCLLGASDGRSESPQATGSEVTVEFAEVVAGGE